MSASTKTSGGEADICFLPRERANSLRQQTISTQCGFASLQKCPRAQKQAAAKPTFVFCRENEQTVCDSRQLARSAGLRVYKNVREHKNKRRRSRHLFFAARTSKQSATADN